jgi:hypothetical protein
MITNQSRARLEARLAFDYVVVMAMADRCPLLDVEAYGSKPDLEARSNQITDPSQGHRATHYRTTHRIPTLIGPGTFADETVIHVDAEVAGYPNKAPASWVLTAIPYSPHFRAGTVICIGEIWDAPERVLLAHVIRHHARLLNWHEEARGGGYVGWNGAAIAYHRKHYGARPLNEGIQYPEIPADVAYGIDGTATEVEDFDLFDDIGRDEAFDELFASGWRDQR